MINNLNDGTDSFLDIVANLVGILIILVVLVGANASNQVQQAPAQADASLEAERLETIEAIETQADLTFKLNVDNRQLELQILEQNQLAAALSDQRHRMLVQAETLRVKATEIESQLEAKLASFDEATRTQQQSQIKLATAEESLTTQLNDVQAKTAALAASFEPVKNKQLKHYPNPIAKTVFSEEIHFRLAEGKLTRVPLEELLALMKDEWRLRAEQSLKTSSSTIETVGPLDGFRLQYQLSAAEIGQGRAIRLDRFQIIPQPSLSGESIDVALAEGSRFREVLSRHEPRRTTVSIWLYPDGFSDHRAIKSWLYENGYEMASWPLEYGRHISGGPNGFKTSAQCSIRSGFILMAFLITERSNLGCTKTATKWPAGRWSMDGTFRADPTGSKRSSRGLGFRNSQSRRID